MGDKELKEKQERLLKMFINACIDEKRFYEMLDRIKQSK